MNRFEKAGEILNRIDADGWLIICNEDSDINSRFMLGVGSHAHHYIYVDGKGHHEVFSVEMEAPMIKKSLRNRNLEVKVQAYKSLEDLKLLLKSLGSKKTIALNFGENIIDANGTPYADYLKVGDYDVIKKLCPNTKFISAAPIIYELRAVKNPEEIKDFKEVCCVTMEILETVPDWVKAGMTEKEVKAKIDYEYLKIGRPSFETIVATGANSADPHHNTSNKKIEKTVLLIDTGLQINEMCSDITWTFWVGSRPDGDFIQAYNALYGAKKIATKYYTEGTPNNIPAIKCRENLQQAGYDHEKLFFHGLGHSLGFEAHDIGERISWKVPEKYVLKENMVYTNEPGLYWEGKWGIRLEDDIIIKKNKCEELTKVPKDVILV
jgi:Xaa-Pro aminopeptidase